MATASLLRTHPFGEAYAAGTPAVAGGARLAALQRAARAEVMRGLPGPKHEEWRFTPLTALARVPFIPAAQADDVDVAAVPAEVPRLANAMRVVLVNGLFRPDLSDQATGVEIGPLPQTLAQADSVLGMAASPALPLVALNTAYMSGGLLIQAAQPGTRPVHLISIGASGSAPVAFHPRIVILTKPGAALTLVETHVGLPGQPFFANPVIEAMVAEDATVRRYVTVSDEFDAFHIATTGVTVAARGSFESFELGLGGHRSHGTVRQETHVAIDGSGAVVRLGGAYAIGGAAHHDFTTVIDHRAGGSTSHQLFKGVLDGRSHGVYQGRVIVAPKAQKTDARQLHKALFLSDGPGVDVKPELEIAADDVQCAHGATTGSLQPDELFYFAARGIDPETARALLVEGFLTDALEEIRDDGVRALFTREVQVWLQKRRGVS